MINIEYEPPDPPIQAGTGLSKSGNTLNLAQTKALVTGTGLTYSDVGADQSGAAAAEQTRALAAEATLAPLNDLRAIGIYSPENYGAAGTYSAGTSDTTAVQNAIDAAQTAKGKVLLRRAYNVSSATINVTAPLTIEGVGTSYDTAFLTQPTVISGLMTTSSSADCLSVTSAGVYLANFLIANRATTPTAGVGVHASQGTNAYIGNITNCVFDNLSRDGLLRQHQNGRWHVLRLP